MALSGNGFFVTQSAAGSVSYTRAGDFTSNASGQLTTPSGNLVMGYPAVDGVVSTTSTLQPIQIGIGSVTPASATTEFNIAGNLNSSATLGTTYSSPTSVYDSLGTSHQLTVTYTNTGTNTWSYTVNVPTADTGASSTVVASGNLTFDSSGNLTSPTGSVPISINSFTDGAAPMTLSWNLNGSSGTPTITQTNLASSTTATADGEASGTLTSYAVATNGTIEGTYSNGQTLALGQVAVANFANTQGLLADGNNGYKVTSASGAAQIGLAGTGGRGTITGGSVESSNVDVATEFAKMIVAQQAYQANARSVTTMNTITQDTIQMMQA
jgi:flagellar hook protein FlgE